MIVVSIINQNHADQYQQYPHAPHQRKLLTDLLPVNRTEIDQDISDTEKRIGKTQLVFDQGKDPAEHR